jgi:galactose mutarotase-like enzyme
VVVLENDAVRLACEPDVGARITSLVDRRTGRDWLVAGTLPGTADAWAAEGAIFGGAEAFGWDECLPTVAPSPDPLNAAEPALRDHGDQWGRPADVGATDERLVATWTRSRWPLRFSRTITLAGAAVVCEYELETRGSRALPILWSMHPLLALEPGSRIVAEPGGDARVTHQEGFPLAPGLETVAWPGGAAALDVVRGADAQCAAKLYLDARSLTRVAARATDGSELQFAWDRAFAPTLGIWLDFGGWPPGESRHQVAIEPTTSADDDLASAIAAGRARILEPGTPQRWKVRLELATASRDP